MFKIHRVTSDKFVGPALISEKFSIDGRIDEDYQWIWKIDALDYPAIWTGADGYAVRALTDCEPEGVVILTSPEGMTCGFYLDAQIWIDIPHRGKRLSIPMILEAARILGGSPIRDNDGCPVGFSAAGYRAHLAAHAEAVLIAHAAGKKIPRGVLSEYGLRALR